MSRTALALRSVYFVLGGEATAAAEIQRLPADAFVFDLEFFTPPAEKVRAREQVCAAVKGGGFGPRQLAIRVNPLTTRWGYDDLTAAATSGANAVLLPKVDGGDAVRDAEQILLGSGAPDDIAIWCMMETPRGVLNAAQIAAASPRVRVFVMGVMDLTGELGAGAPRDRTPVLTSLGLCLLAARAAGVAIVDGVHLDRDDQSGLLRACSQGRDLGFDGKIVRYPEQIDAANRMFSSTEEELATARKIIEADAAAQARGEALVPGDPVESRRTVEIFGAVLAREEAIRKIHLRS